MRSDKKVRWCIGTNYGSRHIRKLCMEYSLLAYPFEVPEEEWILPTTRTRHTYHNGQCLYCGVQA